MKNRKILSIAGLALCLWIFPSLNCSAQIITVSGDISHDTTWSGTVHVTGDVHLLDGNTLTIEPGTTVEFQGHYFLKIYGDLQAIGEEGDSILFTASNSTTGWKGIRFNNTGWGEGDYPGALYNNDTSRLSYCRIQYSRDYPAVYLRAFTKLTIQHSHFYDNQSSANGNVMWIFDAGVLISDCLFRANHYTFRNGGALYLSISEENYIVRNCTFIDNSNSYGGALYVVGADALIENNIFINNEATQEGGAIVIENSDDAILRNNLIVNNEAPKGGAMLLRGSSITSLNNSIANNYASIDGGGIYFEANSDPVHYSDILWGNETTAGTNQGFIDDERSDPSFLYCNIQGGYGGIVLNPGLQLTGTYSGNIELDPEFISPSPGSGTGSGSLSYDWGLKAISPCINAGVTDIPGIELSEVDLAENKRIAFGDVDIGAYEYYLEEATEGGIISQNTVWAADTVRISGDITISDGYSLSILPGVYVEFQGNYAMEVQGTLLAQGKEGFPIIFTIADTTGLASDSLHYPWKGIRFDNTPESNAQSNIDYAILEYAENTNGGALYVNNFSKLNISNTIFRHNYGTYYGGAAYCYDAGVVFLACSFVNNQALVNGGAMYSYNSDISFIYTSITDNYASSGGGIYGTVGSVIIFDHSSISNNNATLKNNVNRGGALNSQEYCTFYMFNSIFANNTSSEDAGAIWIWGGEMLMVNSLVVNNLADSSNIGGIYSLDNSDVSLYNTIVWGNENYYGSELNVSGDVVLYHSDIDQSGMTGSNNINADPEFIMPTQGAGSSYDAGEADWRLSDFSPCINTGTNTINGSALPGTDLDGYPRINQNIVDMGVYEHQGDLPEITYQPDNLILCEGNQATFQVQTGDTARFQWLKDGSPLPGANLSQLTLDTISMDDQGNYKCVVWNAYDTIISNPAYLFVVQVPQILEEPEDTWVGYSGTTELRTYASGNALSYQWTKNGVPIQGAILPYYSLTVADSLDEGRYACIISNTCSMDTTSAADVYLAPQICMVTVDPATGNNLVVWERKSAGPIQNYNVYRESKYAGIYDLMTSVAYEDLGVYTDSLADPTVQAYLYKITATDTSGFETDADLCKTHKTIHLLATKNPETNSTQLDWDRYVGFEYGTYEIFRSDTTINFLSIHFMSSSTSTWADADPGSGTKFYRVAAIRPDTCFPSGDLKAGAGPYHHALSNLDDNKLQSTGIGDISGNSEVSTYPNPMDAQTTIQFPNPLNEDYRFSVMDASGRRVYLVNNITSDRVTFLREGLPSGLYIFELRGPRVYRGKIMIR